MSENLKMNLINNLIKREDGYVNDPDDSGKETNFGITIDTARAYGYGGEMINLPKSMAFDIYVARYWNTICGDALLDISPKICNEVFDTNVNIKYGEAARILQRSLKVLGKVPIDVDGFIGKETLYALRSYLAVRDENTLLKALNCLQGAFYISLTEAREKDKKFIYGWLKNRVII